MHNTLLAATLVVGVIALIVGVTALETQRQHAAKLRRLELFQAANYALANVGAGVIPAILGAMDERKRNEAIADIKTLVGSGYGSQKGELSSYDEEWIRLYNKSASQFLQNIIDAPPTPRD